MRLTAFEQGIVQVRERADEQAGYLDPSLGRALVDLGDRMEARIASWHGRDALRIHQFVGAVRVGDLRLEILPKIDGLTEPAEIRRNLLGMLAETQDLYVRASELTGFLETSEPFIAALARLYLQRLLETVRRGLRQDYVLHEDQLAYLRGKVDWSKHLKLQASQRLEFPCIFDERSADTPQNRILKAALLAASRWLEDSRTSSTITELRHAMDSVTDVTPSLDDAARVRTDRMSRQLEPLLTLAKLILRGRNPDQGRASKTSKATYALAWDMNVLFEEYVGRVTARALQTTGLKVELQAGARHLAMECARRRPAFLLKPDILMQAGRRPVAVADTKWKRLNAKARDLGVSEADVYQLLAYASRYEVDRAYLIYPHHPALGLPGIKREYDIEGQTRVVVVTVDVARTETVEAQLLAALGQRSSSTLVSRSHQAPVGFGVAALS